MSARGAVLEKVLEVVAGGEHAGAAGDDEAADLRIVLRGVDRVAHHAVHVLRDRVLLLGRRSMITRVWSSSVTIRCLGMGVLAAGRGAAAASLG